jgi:hypothetical protein
MFEARDPGMYEKHCLNPGLAVPYMLAVGFDLYPDKQGSWGDQSSCHLLAVVLSGSRGIGRTKVLKQ